MTRVRKLYIDINELTIHAKRVLNGLSSNTSLTFVC